MKELYENLARLEELSKKICLKDIAYKENNFIEYDLEKGTCTGVGLCKTDDVSIQLVTVGKDTYFPRHSHPAQATYLVLKGEIINENGNVRQIKAGECVTIPANVNHHVYSKEGAFIVAVVAGRDEGFPDV